MDIVEKAINLALEGKIREAEKKLDVLISRRRDDPRVWFLKGLIERNKGRNEEALKALNRATELRSDFAEAWILKGFILRDLRMYDDALRALNKAYNIELEEDDYEDYELLIEMAHIYVLMGQINKAIELLNKAQEINPEDENLKKLLKSIQ